MHHAHRTNLPIRVAHSARDQRAAVRFDATMPVQVEGGAGLAHNISAQGVYFETDVEHRLGELVNLSIEFTLYGRKHRLVCEGKVVRIQQEGKRVGVAARLLAPFFEGEEQAAPPPLR